MTKRAMISQPMAGKTDEEIAEARDKAHAKLREMGYEFVNTLFTDEWYSDEAMEERGVVQVPLCYLAKSLENMSLCHAAYRTHADAASSMMPPSRTGLRCCMRISDEERREAVEFLRSGTCLYFAGHRKTELDCNRCMKVSTMLFGHYRPLRCTLRAGQLRDRCVAKTCRPHRPSEREYRAFSVSWSPALDKVLPWRASFRGYANGV